MGGRGGLLAAFANHSHFHEPDWQSPAPGDAVTVKSTPQFVGREVELATLAEALRRTSEGVGSAFVVKGEAGIGKSRLIDEALRTLEGGTVFRASCGELERDVAFAAIASAFGAKRSAADPALVAIADLIGSRDSAGGLRFRVVDEVLDVLERRALEGPVALVIDDLHRADPGTLLVAKRLVHGVDVLPIAFLCTIRPHPRPPEVLDAIEAAQWIELSSLDADEVASLAADILDAAPGSDLSRALETCAGNPLYVVELISALRSDERVSVIDGTAELFAGELPESLRLTILSQLSFLSEETARTLRMAACLGSTFDATTLSAVTGQSGVALLDTVAPLLRSGILVERGARLAFRHDLVREAAYEDAPAAVRVKIHEDIARALREAGHPPGEIAPHVLRSARLEDESAIAVLRQAAKDAVPLSSHAAIEFLQHALDQAPAEHPERTAMSVELAAALSAAGRQDEADALARSALALARDPSTRQSARSVLVQTLMVRDRTRASVDLLELMAAEEHLDGGDRARYLAQAARAWAKIGEHARALAIAPEALRLATDASDENARCHALLALAWASGIAGDFAAAARFTQEAVDVGRVGTADVATRADAAWMYLYTFGMVVHERDRARTLAKAELRRAEEAGHVWVVPMLNEMLAYDHLRWGELDDASSAAQAAIRTAEDLGAQRFMSGAYATLGRTAILQDDPSAAEGWLLRAQEQAAHEDLPVLSATRVWPGWTELYEARGQDERALQTLSEAFETVPVRSLLVSYAPRFVRHLLNASRAAEARDVVEAFEQWHESLVGSPHEKAWEGFVLQSRALVDRDVDTALAAVDAHRNGFRGFFALELALEDAASILSDNGRNSEAIKMLDEATRLWEDTGATLHTMRIGARLRQLGVRRGVRGSRGRPKAGWDALTPSEIRVAALVAEGLTYREVGERLFLSRRTVESHVARIFVKLGIASRREVASHVRRHGADETVHHS